MPLHEYACRNCGAESELLIRSAGERPACPACGSRALTRKLSTFAPRSAAPSPPSCASRRRTAIRSWPPIHRKEAKKIAAVTAASIHRESVHIVRQPRFF